MSTQLIHTHEYVCPVLSAKRLLLLLLLLSTHHPYRLDPGLTWRCYYNTEVVCIVSIILHAIEYSAVILNYSKVLLLLSNCLMCNTMLYAYKAYQKASQTFGNIKVIIMTLR